MTFVSYLTHLILTYKAHPPPPPKKPTNNPSQKNKTKNNTPANFSYAGVKFSKPPVTVQILYMNPSCCEINFTNVQSSLRAKSLSGPQIFSFYLELLFCLYLIWANGYFVLAVTSHVPR